MQAIYGHVHDYERYFPVYNHKVGPHSFVILFCVCSSYGKISFTFVVQMEVSRMHVLSQGHCFSWGHSTLTVIERRMCTGDQLHAADDLVF